MSMDEQIRAEAEAAAVSAVADLAATVHSVVDVAQEKIDVLSEEVEEHSWQSQTEKRLQEHQAMLQELLNRPPVPDLTETLAQHEARMMETFRSLILQPSPKSEVQVSSEEPSEAPTESAAEIEAEAPPVEPPASESRHRPKRDWL
jgi:hypothetical protein